MDFVRSDSAESKATLPACLLLLTFLVHANALVNGFVYDDHSQIELNPNVHSFHNIAKIFGTSLLSQQGKQAVGNYYRPLMNLDFLLCFKLFGASPYGFHLINILLHCIVVWLVYAVTVALVSDEVSGETFGLIAAACFALHPIHTEPVTWIDGVADLEMSIFYLLRSAFLLFLRLGREENDGVASGFNWGCVEVFSLRLMPKEPAITLPAVATIYEHFFRTDRGSTSWKKKLSRYGGLWVTGMAYLVIRGIVLGGFAPVPLHTDIGMREAVLTGVALLGQYAAKLL